MLLHVRQAFIGINCRQHFVNRVVGDLGIGDPQGRILERRGFFLDAAVSTRRHRQLAEVRVLVEETAFLGVFTEVDQLDVVGLRGHDNRAAGKCSEQPESVELLVTESLGRIVVSHGVAFDLVPHAHVVEEQFTVGECAGTGVTDADFLADKVLRAFDAGSLANHQLRRGAVQPGDRHHVFILLGVVFHLAVTAQVNVAGIDHAHLRLAGIYLAQVFHRTGGRLGADANVLGLLNRIVNLNRVGYHLESSAGWTAAEHHFILGRRGHRRQHAGCQQRRTGD